MTFKSNFSKTHKEYKNHWQARLNTYKNANEVHDILKLLDL